MRGAPRCDAFPAVPCLFFAPGTDLRSNRHRCRKRESNSSSERASKLPRGARRSLSSLMGARAQNTFFETKERRHRGCFSLALEPLSSWPIAAAARLKTSSGSLEALLTYQKARKGATFVSIHHRLFFPVSLERNLSLAFSLFSPFFLFFLASTTTTTRLSSFLILEISPSREN